MNILRKLAFFTLASVLTIVTTPLSARVAPVGTVSDVNVYAFGTQPQSKRAPKFLRDGVVQGELLETVPLGSMIVIFVDDTTLTLGSSAQLLVDELVFDPQSKNDSAVFKMMAGSFYYVSGQLSKRSVTIITPVATIGIRGTEFTVSVSQTGATTVGVLDGVVSVTSAVDQTTSVAEAGQSVSVGETGVGTSLTQGVQMTMDIAIDKAIQDAAKAGNKAAKEALKAAEKAAKEAAKAVEKAAKEAAKAAEKAAEAVEKAAKESAKEAEEAAEEAAKAEKQNAESGSSDSGSSESSGGESSGSGGGGDSSGSGSDDGDDDGDDDSSGSGSGNGDGGGANSGSSCFAAGTQILMFDGTAKSIEEVSVGERVIGRDGVVNTVTGMEQPKLGTRKLYSLNGGRHFVTAEHPFLTTEGWKSIDPVATLAETPGLRVGSLRLGDTIITGHSDVDDARWGTVVITAIEAVETDPDLTVYNLLLDGNNSYVADGFVVHNKGGD